MLSLAAFKRYNTSTNRALAIFAFGLLLKPAHLTVGLTIELIGILLLGVDVLKKIRRHNGEKILQCTKLILMLLWISKITLSLFYSTSIQEINNLIKVGFIIWIAMEMTLYFYKRSGQSKNYNFPTEKLIFYTVIVLVGIGLIMKLLFIPGYHLVLTIALAGGATWFIISKN